MFIFKETFIWERSLIMEQATREQKVDKIYNFFQQKQIYDMTKSQIGSQSDELIERAYQQLNAGGGFGGPVNELLDEAKKAEK